MIPFAWIARRLISQKPSSLAAHSNHPSQRFFIMQVLPAAILEAGSLKSLVAYLIEGQTFSLVIAAIVAGFIITLWPADPDYNDSLFPPTSP
ncbi:hypothetical protein K2X85_01665 [bacterium]|nr:hypothetical protein [bacterium]